MALGIGRVAVWADCVCGSEIEFEDGPTEYGEHVSQKCEGCGRTIEVFGTMEVQDITSTADRRKIEANETSP
jgi:hypothetical protein